MVPFGILWSFVMLGANSVLHYTLLFARYFHICFTSQLAFTTSFQTFFSFITWIKTLDTDKMPSLTSVLLHSIAYMAEKFPDKWMEKIPYYRAREEELEEEEREARRRARKDKRSHSHSHKRSGSHRRARHYDDDEESDSYDEEYDRRDRRRHRSLDGRRQQGEHRSSYRKSYNPADYAPVDRHGYAVQPPVSARPVVVRCCPSHLKDQY
jgi:hypothetical protein